MYLLKILGVLLMLLLMNGKVVVAQNDNYNRQIKALEAGFNQRSIDSLSTMLSSELVFPPFPAAQSKGILRQVFSRFPKLNSLEILEVRDKYALLKYYFEGSRGTKSAVRFDDEGKITRIELIEQVIEREIEQSKSVHQPNPGEMANKYPAQSVSFQSNDGLLVTGNLYEIDPNAPVILLCHQGGYNKFEYADIAPKLNELGFNCLAIDQRSGGAFAGQENQTFLKATEEERDTDFLQAEQDINAAIKYLSERYQQKVTIWGSSYSSILVLFQANEDEVEAVISFSPSDFFEDERPPLAQIISNIDKPYFITSSKRESTQLSEIMKLTTQGTNQIHYIPEVNGFHGSRSLWESQTGAEEYWKALISFLTNIYPSIKQN
ncbi:alpha/beta hydrolase [Roseivirga sp.]|uniref:alpha/beta hydrolase n=1 Tax=Roseivirga sp. TaxID=1964215 RepID=UPI003B52F84B